jgi:superfamily I DNA/RNA helicase
MSRTPGRRWSSIAVLTRTNAQLTAVKAAMDAALVPSRVAGSDLGPASDLRADAGAGTAGSPGRPPNSGTGRGPDIDSDDVLDARTTFVDDPAGQDHVVLTTFHRAKGLQWPTVLVLGLGAGLMPIASAQTEAAIDEERRLLYVALTRSEDELYCSWFERAGDDLGAPARKPSPWLAPIEQTVARLDKDAAPTAAAEVSARVAELRQRLVEGTEGADVTR